MKQTKLIILSLIQIILSINYILCNSQFVYTPQLDQSKYADKYDYKPGKYII